MDGNPIYFTQTLSRTADACADGHAGRIVDFYEAASLDYEYWSRELNMHLGFYRHGVSPLDRGMMLEEFNREIATRMQIDSSQRSLLFDLGCGMGAVARTIAGYYPNAFIKGVTLSPLQIKIANEKNVRAGLSERIEIFHGNYLYLPTEDRSVDGAWAVESACYAKGPDKEDLIREMARVLKPGGRFVIADCFLKRPESELNALLGVCYRSLCRKWELREMPQVDSFVTSLKRFRFEGIHVEDISWRTVPSLVHAPFAVASFLARKFIAGERLNRHSKDNLKASLIAPVLGLNRSKFSYYMISGTAT